MRHRNTITTLFIILANICMLAHNMVPHCHHHSHLCLAIRTLEQADTHNCRCHHKHPHTANQCFETQWFIPQSSDQHQHHHGAHCNSCDAVPSSHLLMPLIHGASLLMLAACTLLPNEISIENNALRAPPLC